MTEQNDRAEAGTDAPKPARNSLAMLAVLRIRNFRLLWVSSGIAMLGDSFYMIALPWLVLKLTGSAVAVGAVMATAGVPRALLMLVGGAVIDRFSPRAVLLISSLLRAALVGVLAYLVLTGVIQLWMLYLLAFTFGFVDAFSYPASAAMVPRLVERPLLQGANALLQGTGQLTMLTGPALAGGLIALLTQVDAQAAGTPGAQGIGIAFGFNACTFLVSAIALSLMRMRGIETQEDEDDQPSSMWHAIREGLVNVWNDATLRALFFVIAGINFLLVGPISVGIPVLADVRLAEGAAAFGIIMSCFGGGALVGTILAGVLPNPGPRRMGAIFIIFTTPIGLGLALLGGATTTSFAAAMTLVMGLAEGYVTVLFITWLQVRIPMAMLGRMMSLVMFASVGLQPLSMALTGPLIKLNMTALFIGAGSLMLIIAILSLLSPAVRAMGYPRPKAEA